MLIGIDPDYSEKVDVLGAEFTLRRLPHGKWARLRQEAVDAYAVAQRKAIAILAARGEDPSDPLDKEQPQSPTKLAFATMRSPEYVEAIAQVEVEIVRWGVTSHAGLLKPDGSPVPFEPDTVSYEGEPLLVVGRQTLRWYRANPLILRRLYNALWRICELEPAEKKD